MERRKFIETGLGLGAALPLLSLMSAIVPLNAAESPKGEPDMPVVPQSNPRLRIFITGSASGLGHLAAQTLLAEGAYWINQRNRLSWTLTLKPGEEVKLGYQYDVWVR